MNLEMTEHDNLIQDHAPWSKSSYRQWRGTSLNSKQSDETGADAAETELSWSRLLHRSIPAIYFILDQTGRVELVSQFGAERLGYPSEELMQRSIDSLIEPADWAVVQAALIALLRLPNHPQIWTCRFIDCNACRVEVKITACLVSIAGRCAIQFICEEIRDRQQSERFQQVQQLNQGLEALIQKRTAQLQKMLDFEALLKRITDRVRDSLDESQILHTAVQELASVLGTHSCDTALYDLDQGFSTIRYEFVSTPMTVSQGRIFHFSHHPEIYSQLLAGQPLQCCWITKPSEARSGVTQFTTFACPLIDDQGVIGDMWLYRSREDVFDETEIRLVQQVANQCAIAIRQARLFEAAQIQVTELERLNQLKDDFLSTVSHELRSPMANIAMATQMLEMLLDEQGILATAGSRILHYFQMLRGECQRETDLINDLLDLSRLEAGSEPLLLTAIDLQVWVAHIAEPFLERARSQQQYLQINVPAALPPLKTDLASLERILTELLHNACKYTPAGEQITIAAELLKADGSAAPGLISNRQDLHQTVASLSVCSHEAIADAVCPPCLPASFLLLHISNSGVEIPDTELSRIFDKFYRIPSHDPWKCGGTGLGLALVKRLVEHLGATIQVQYASGWLTFSIKFPLLGS
jgi:PAS domain S-box-containing protein